MIAKKKFVKTKAWELYDDAKIVNECGSRCVRREIEESVVKDEEFKKQRNK